MNRVLVIVNAPYPVAVTGGRHLCPGEGAVEVENDKRTRSLIRDHILTEIAPPRRLRSQPEVTPQEKE